MLMHKTLILLTILASLGHGATLSAQAGPISGPTGADNASVIDDDANHIRHPAALAAFFQKLRDLEQGKTSQLRIAHLGDSHVQADFLSGTLRTLFQERFGNAGRGLVFFYEQAGTHSPLDYQTKSDVEWQGRRRTFQRDAPPIGLSGMSIATTAPRFQLHFTADSMLADRITLFHNPRQADYRFQLENFDPLHTTRPPLQADWASYEVSAGDTLYEIARRFGCRVRDLQAWNQLAGSHIQPGQVLLFRPAVPEPASPVFSPVSPFSSVVELSAPVGGFSLRGWREAAAGQAILYGMLLENTRQRGILFNMMGVNGATFQHFNRADHFRAQLRTLQPDLILITLGTNEALQRTFPADRIEAEIRDFLQKLRTDHPGASILLMSNPPVLLQRKYEPAQVGEMRDMLAHLAREYGAAFWDWYAVMGGKGAIRDWEARGLASRDFIHFTEKGYILLADALYQAIMDGLHATD